MLDKLKSWIFTVYTWWMNPYAVLAWSIAMFIGGISWTLWDDAGLFDKVIGVLVALVGALNFSVTLALWNEDE